LLERVTQMEALVEKIKPRVPQLVATYQERLTARLKDALKEAAAALDEDRLRQELVMYASKVDVEEELSRLIAHLAETRRILTRGGAAGKRLDFLMQELNREANTLGSKSVDIDVSQASVELKVLIEQMRSRYRTSNKGGPWPSCGRTSRASLRQEAASVLNRKFVDKFRCLGSDWVRELQEILRRLENRPVGRQAARSLGSGGHHGEASQHSIAVNWAVFGGELMI
jgi:hypothetical protein